jgi:hypothetical protein
MLLISNCIDCHILHLTIIIIIIMVITLLHFFAGIMPFNP